ncbi:MAG TPA: hypothetical protein VEQ42_09125 [Pyrinomonadaceae bacterium]|nr:hypothetical protein [Pyrinomonadaceae bacterium]
MRNLRNIGIAVLVGSAVVSGLLLALWVVSLVFALGGGLAHLLLIIGPLIGFVGVPLGVVLIIVGRTRKP